MISTTAVDRLMQLGRRRGGLQIDDIRQALPVDTMAIEELADVTFREASRVRPGMSPSD